MTAQHIREPLIFTLSGLLIGLGIAAFIANVYNVSQVDYQSRLMDQINDKPENPFQNTRLISEKMNSIFENTDFLDQMESDLLGAKRSFLGEDSLFSSHLNPKLSIEKEETSQDVTYLISFEGSQNHDSMDVNVEGRLVRISGQRNQTKKGKFDGSFEIRSASTFSQTFTLPDNLDSENVEIKNRDHMVILKFPKKNQGVAITSKMDVLLFYCCLPCLFDYSHCL